MAPGPGSNILHADLDAFYASVEQVLDPSLQGRPMAVGGGVVLAASYQAKAFGITAGMAGWRARQLCPELVFVGGHFREYQRLGDAVMAILEDFTPLVERISIDEAFLDVAGSVHLFGPPERMAEDIRARVRAETGLAISVGVARTKHLAKIASQVAKPDGLVVVPLEREGDFLRPLPVGLIWGVGPATRARLAARGITTIGQLAKTDEAALQLLVGRAAGSKLSALAANIDPRSVVGGRRVSSVGAQSALGRRRASPDLVRTTLGYLVDRVGGRLRRSGRAGRTVTVRVRFPGMRTVSRSATLRQAVASTPTLTDVAVELALAALAGNPEETEVTLLAVSVSHLVDEPPTQLVLPFASRPGRLGPDEPDEETRRAVDASMDTIRARFGRQAVGFANVELSPVSRVPDEFRELAERGSGPPGSASPAPSSSRGAG